MAPSADLWRPLLTCGALCRDQETRAAIIPELVELASDEEVAVRLAAFRTLVDMLDILDGGEGTD